MKYGTFFVIEPSFTLLAKVLLVRLVETIFLYVIGLATWAYYIILLTSNLSQQTGTPSFIRKRCG